MQAKSYVTPQGAIRYWVEKLPNADVTLVFLPGLTADHRLFDKQIGHFEGKYSLFVWDAPGHAESRPFDLAFSLADKAAWLAEILVKEELPSPVLIGQSMGGYLAQAFAELYPDRIAGFVSIDSAPLQRKYLTAIELWLLKRMEPVYRHFPWKWLLKFGSSGVATSPYGQQLMYDMMMVYDGDHAYYAALCGHGYRMLADAVEADLPYELPCPALLLCGTKDQAGSCIRYDKAWHRETGIPLVWIEGAGHNSNTDAPDEVNALIGDFVENEVLR